jgi:hypothetical protein
MSKLAGLTPSRMTLSITQMYNNLCTSPPRYLTTSPFAPLTQKKKMSESSLQRYMGVPQTSPIK